jgi:two-component system phosphate regulon response regulator PhoB
MTGLVTVVEVARRQRQALASPPRAAGVTALASVPPAGYLLVVSEYQPFANELSAAFSRYGYTVEAVREYDEAVAIAMEREPVLVLVDRRWSAWRSLKQAPIFRTIPMMTLVSSETPWSEDVCAEDLEFGMDGAHVCGGSFRLLIAKIRAILRRSTWLEQRPSLIHAGNMEMNVEGCEVRIAGCVHHLPPVQFRLLRLLMEAPGRVFHRAELFEHIWGRGYAIEDHTLDVHLFWLRRMLERDPGGRQTIATVRGVGVKFVLNEPISRSVIGCRDRATRRNTNRTRLNRHRREDRLQVAKHRSAPAVL